VGVPLLLIALVVAYVAATFAQVWWTARRDEARPVDAIVVLGAAQYDGQPSGALQGRLDHAWDLWERHLAKTIIVTGGNQPGDRTTEGLTGFTYLRGRGVPEASILVEVGARSTFEALSASRLILDQHGLRTALLVSDPYHNLRLKGVAGELGLDAQVSPTSAHSDGQALVRETVAVALGRMLGYGRLSRL
jgi:uncharacterized SAM-binding protein YcdF (DUF218 family)